MSEPPHSGAVPALPLDPRLRELLRDLPEAQAAVLDALVRDRDRLVALAERRAERLQRLQEASATLSRSLDRDDIERELARQVERTIACDGVVVARTSEDGGATVSLYRHDGADRPAGGVAPVRAAVLEVVRTGRPSRAAERADPENGAPAPHVLAVPLLVGYTLAGVLAVHGNDAAFGSEDEELLQTLSSTAATALVNATLFAESLREKRNARLYEEAIEATRELSAAFDAIAGGMAVVDGEGFITRHNARLATFSGAAAGTSLAGRALFEALLHEPLAISPGDPIGAALVRREVGRGTLRPAWCGRVFDIVASPHPAGGAVVTVDDVTDSRARDAALGHAEARYERLVESAEDAICTLDADGRITSVNRALERALGRERASLVGTPFPDLLPSEERADKWRMFSATLRGARQRQELRTRSAKGRVRIASVITAPIFERGTVAGVLAILRDVTDERALLEQVVRRDKLAALGELVGGVAHEVNSPLTSILAFGQILQSSPPAGSEARKAVNTIVNEAKRAARIIGKFLTFARQQPSEKMRTDLNQVLLDTVELRRYPLRMQQIALDLDLAEHLPVTWADPFQLQQVFINLLNNAEQALVEQPGERRIRVRTEQRGAALLAVVSDSGPGIAPEHLPHIFNPFYTTKARGVGTGLGLSISFGIVREHGGVLRVHSEPGQGAAFEVSLPIVAPPAVSNG